jgi:hypothetical protein
MRFHLARTGACWFLLLGLLGGFLLAGGLLSVIPANSPTDAAIAKNGNTRSSSVFGRAETGKTAKAKNRNKRALAALDARRIAAANAETVEALACGDLIAVRAGDRVYCTHGEDPEPPAGARSAEAASSRRDLARALCIDDGVSGPRVQVVYVHRSDRPDRLSALLPTFRRLASEMDLVYDRSARKSGQSLRVRFVTDHQCQVEFETLAATPATLRTFQGLIARMARAGFDRLDRKYLMLVDDSVFCGVGTFNSGRNADARNTRAHDFTGYARVDLPCWDAGTMAHELAHTMGAVQYSAPHTSRGGHCIDEWDVMCYSDQPFRPEMRYLCQDGAQDFRLDCGNNDYFAAKPKPGSYLARHWNLARSRFLTAGHGPTCVDAAREPDDAYWYDYWKVPMPKFPVGKSERRAFCEEPGDTDWVRFEAKRGQSYEIATTALAAGVDTQLVLYYGFIGGQWSEMDVVARNDDRAPGDPSSAIRFTALRDGSHLVGVAEADGRAGFDRTYTLSIKTVKMPRGKDKPDS